MSSSDLALVPPPAFPVEPAHTAQAERPARALIGWMRPEDAHRFLLSNRNDAAPDAVIEAAQKARYTVAARPDGIDQHQLVTALPAELEHHVQALRASPAADPMFAEGWQVALVDLTRVCGFQPVVLSDQAISRVQAVDEHDLASIAAITLPLAESVQLPIQFDPIRQAWTVVSANQNLRVASPVGPMPASPGGMVLGFAITAGPSFMQVGRYHGRHFLRDGAPAFVRDVTVFEELMPDPRTMLPQDSYRGPRPPVLPDYLDDTVSAAVQVPAAHKMIVIHALELTPPG